MTANLMIFANAIGSLPLQDLDNNFANLNSAISSATGNITFSNTTISTATPGSDITITTSTTGNTSANWVFGSNGNLTLPGKINSSNSIAITAVTTGASNITLTANGAVGNSTFIFDSSGNLTSPGNVYAPAFIGSGQYLGNLDLNPTISNIVLDIANTNSNVANTNSVLSNTVANIVSLTTGLANTNANVANTNANVANLTVSVANLAANIGNLQANSYSNVNAAAYLAVYGGNIYSNNINSFGNVGGQYVYSSQDIRAGGNLYVNGTDTIIDSTQITSNVTTLTLNHDVETSNINDLDGSGLILGNGLVSWLYDSQSSSWQSSSSIQPNGAPYDLGSSINPWGNVYVSAVITGAFGATSIVANVANIGDLGVGNTTTTNNLIVSNNANIIGDLRVNGNSTLINATAISSNVSTLILDKDNSTGLLADGSGIQIGLPAVATLLYNYNTGSWQSSIDITPSSNTLANIGNVNNLWSGVYTNNVSANNVSANNTNSSNVYSELVYSTAVYGNAVLGIDASLSGNVTVDNVITANSIVGLVNTAAQPNITSLGNLVSLTAIGNITTANYFIGNGRFLTGMPELYGNANVANYLPIYSGNISANIVTANFFIGDGSQVTNVAAVTANTVVDNAQPNITSVGTLTSLSVSGNIDTANINTANINANIISSITFTAQSIVGDIIANVVTTKTLTGNIVSSVSILGNIETAAQPNITSVGILTSLSVSGNLAGNTIAADTITANLLAGVNLANAVGGFVYSDNTGTLLNSSEFVYDSTNSIATVTATLAANIITVGNTVSAIGNIQSNSYILGNGFYLTGMPELYGNANVAAYLPTYTGNITAGNISATGNIEGSYILGNGSQLTGMPELYGNANVANYLPTYSGNITATDISVNGNITANYYFGDGSQLSGMYGNANVANYIPTYSGNIGSIVSTGNISVAGNVNANALLINGAAVITGNANIQGTLTYNDITNLVTDNLILGLGNNQTGINVTNSGIVVGNTNEATFLYDFTTQSWNSNINLLVAGNVVATSFTGNVVALTVSEPDQPNITSVGSLTSLTVVGNTLSGNFLTDNRISAQGNIYSAANISAAYFIGNGSELSDIVANVDHMVNGNYTVSLNSTGTVIYPDVEYQQQALTGTTTTVYGDPYTYAVPNGQTQIIWTATSANVIGFKMTARAQMGNSTITNVEIADIACSWDGTTTIIANALTIANASFTVSNRVKSNISAADTTFFINCNGVGKLIVQARNNNLGNAYFTHSVTEFTKTL